MNIRIEFDGGTSCNIPRLGFGNGYGSYKIDNEPVYRCFFNRPMSANAAEILTLVHAINAIRSRDFPVDRIRLSIYGDSQIALRWASSFGPNSIARKPRKISAKSTDIFRESIHSLRAALSGFEDVHTQWRSRTFSVTLFGH